MPANDPPRPLPRRLLAALSLGNVGVAAGFGLTAALVYAPIFQVPFPVLLGRTLFLAAVLLLTFLAAQQVPEDRLPRWLPRGVFTALAVGAAAPLATFLIYLVSVGGDLGTLVRSPPRLVGLALLSGTALVLGLVVTLSAQLRVRLARARELELQFTLERTRLERQALDARLALLTAQIQPHFLFNTLANIQALVESGSPRAAEVLRSLVAYLRAALPRLQQTDATLGDEFALVRAYLDLMRMRMPDRLDVEVAADPGLESQKLPPMALLTLVENAVRHGIDPAVDGGRIEVSARRDAEGGALRLTVADTGVGMSEHAAPGVGLANLRERLQGAFGGTAELRLSENAPRGLRAEIVIAA